MQKWSQKGSRGVSERDWQHSQGLVLPHPREGKVTDPSPDQVGSGGGMSSSPWHLLHLPRVIPGGMGTQLWEQWDSQAGSQQPFPPGWELLVNEKHPFG